MAKAKYKIGMMVSVDGRFGIVDSVVTKTDGFRYGLADEMDTYAEEDINAAYREVKQRSKKKKTSKELTA